MVSRVLLRQRLKCRSFSWYLREVFPDQLRPERDFVGYGQVSHSVPNVEFFEHFLLKISPVVKCQSDGSSFTFTFNFTRVVI